LKRLHSQDHQEGVSGNMLSISEPKPVDWILRK